ncbi:hypothetical protein TraAM80_07050 [Trypanosoma rangeli]|uniref:Uncharacterized protein n=1 Tax=Trypanosoma rangeli TaxID=5698 RepID=A0A3R7MF63_TRYRA|nr:uncharacterized protein TraAM80_07050 [Trypanosoma rangeli]RNF01399.1 hypothetical protein TraAM80_07050 [Trypanosoma rangeli]|eukprot:RNF01399.1 hypothetical protein TraAM80_07050 [Trypanosoma rangeli]
MAFMLLLRAIRYCMYGAYQRRQLLRANPQAIVDPLKKHYTCVYAGIRMADIFGHVNNAKYLEMCELARWHYAAYSGLAQTYLKKRTSLVVASVSIQYVRELPPCRSYLVTTEVLRFEDAGPVSVGPTSGRDGSGVAKQLPPAGRMVFMHEIWSMDKKILHAGILLRAALVGDSTSPLAIPSGGQRRSKHALLDCRAAYAVDRSVDDVNRLTEANLKSFYHRLGFQPNQEGFQGEPWIEASRRLEKEWRSKLQGVNEP